MHPVRTAAILVAVLMAGAGTVAVASSSSGGSGGDRPRYATAALNDADGNRLGRVTFTQHGGRVLVQARGTAMPPGFHGFHVHAVGQCDPPTFQSALGHLKEGDQVHGEHIGDLPVLLVNGDGSARLTVTTDRFEIADLRDEDGSAVIVHARADNYANIPERYAPEPDEETLATGDSGSRIACGVVR